jgi:hypothetical protein
VVNKSVLLKVTASDPKVAPSVDMLAAKQFCAAAPWDKEATSEEIIAYF